MKRTIILLFVVLATRLTNAQGCLPEGITFTTQEQIDNFQTNYPGCVEIEGSVLISGNNITNLNGLNVLSSVGGDFYIWYNYNLTSLTGLAGVTYIGGELSIILNEALSAITGLEGLTSIGGAFEITGNGALTSLTVLEGLNSVGGDLVIRINYALNSLTGLEGLSSIGGNLYISDNLALTTLTGLEGLTSIGGGLSIHGNESLCDCSVQSICDYLLFPAGSVEILNNANGCNNPPEIAIACGFQLPCLAYGHYILTSQEDIENFQTNYPGCTELEGNLIIYDLNGGNITNLNGLSVLTSIGGNLEIEENESLIGLEGLEGFTSVGGSITVKNNDALTSLIGLGGVTIIGSYLNIKDNDALTSLAGLDNIQASSITDLKIISNSNLSECDVYSVCQYLTSPNGIIEIHDNTSGCNSKEEIELQCLTSVDEYISAVLTILPNPSKDKITVIIPEVNGNARIAIFDVDGKNVLEQDNIEAETPLDISALPRGVYFVRVKDERQVLITKLIKQ
jgi:hypothetical protein